MSTPGSPPVTVAEQPLGASAGAASRPPATGGALAFILVTITLDFTGGGILIPVIPKLIDEFVHGGLAKAAVYGGLLTTLFAVVQFFAGPVLGNLSDQYGRRPVLLLSLVAFGAAYVLMGFAPSLGWLFVAQGLTGLFGATLGTAAAYIADVTPREDRSKRFGAMGAAIGTGLVVGPVIGGLLVEYGARLPFFAAASLSLANVLFGVFVLPESLPKHHRRPFRWSRAHPVGALLELRKYPGAIRLMTGVLIMQVVAQTLPSTWPYYTMQKLGWSARMVGYSLGVYGICNILVQAFVTGRLSKRLGNFRMAELGFLMVGLGYLGFAFGPSTAFVVAAIPVTVLGFLTQPAIVSMISGQIGPEGQGALQGVVASATSCAAIVTPLIMTNLFSYFAAADAPIHFAGAPYVLAAALAAVGSLIVLRGARPNSSTG